MKIQLLSDLHMEFWPKSLFTPMYDQFQTDADVLVLAGDINVGRTNTLACLKQFSKMYKHVIYVMGNHEEYGSEFGAFNDKASFADKLPVNVYFLDEQKYTIIGDIVFFGGCLYTNFGNDPLAEQMAGYGINDFVRIRSAGGYVEPVDYAKEFNATYQRIKNVYNAFPAHKKVIVTHFLPAMECVSPRFLDGGPINKYFANNLGSYIDTLQNTTWMFGHTHDSIDMVIGDTRLLCNPYGYFGTEVNPNFNYTLICEL